MHIIYTRVDICFHSLVGTVYTGTYFTLLDTGNVLRFVWIGDSSTKSVLWKPHFSGYEYKWRHNPPYMKP